VLPAIRAVTVATVQMASATVAPRHRPVIA
jgi:hypothetical protein